MMFVRRTGSRCAFQSVLQSFIAVIMNKGVQEVMLYPSIDELVRKADSKYSLVVAAARRARQLREGARTDLTSPKSHKNVGMSLEEIHLDMITIEQADQLDEEK